MISGVVGKPDLYFLEEIEKKKNQLFDFPSINAGAYLRRAQSARAQPAYPAYRRQGLTLSSALHATLKSGAFG
jgi:hypothetical protein